MLVGVDIGTQSLKAVVTDSHLSQISEASRSYNVDFPAPDLAEQDPRLWESALGPAIYEALALAGYSPSEVDAIALCGQLDGCLPVDNKGEALGNCLIWMDRRAMRELDDIDAENVRTTTGIISDPGHLAAKARWFKRNAENPRSIARFHQPVSFMVERLTGVCVIDHALASTSMVYDLRQRSYDDKLLAAFDLSPNELPAIANAYELAGTLNNTGSLLTGLPTGLPVAVGTGDDFSTPLGAGICETDQLTVAIGTGEVVGCVFPGAQLDPQRLVETHAYPAGNYFIENPGWLSGGAVKWLTGLLAIPDFQSFDALAASAPVGSDGLLFLPALTGAMTPEWNSHARGCFYGMTPVHGPRHFARALLEGCSFAMRDIVTRLIELGARPREVMILAGGSRSRLWAQIRSDTLKLPATILFQPHTSPLGAAMLAGVASGLIADLPTACALVSRPTSRLTPATEASERLDESYHRYRSLFTALKPLF